LHAFHPDHQKFNSHFSINLVVFVGGPESGVDLFFYGATRILTRKAKSGKIQPACKEKFGFNWRLNLNKHGASLE
jgi:hypothetical protein